MTSPAQEIAQTWRTNAKINLLIPDAIPDNVYDDKLSKPNGRDAAAGIWGWDQI